MSQILEVNGKPTEYFSSTEAAKKLGVDRSTLVRLEQAGKIPKVKWSRSPHVRRLYTADDIKGIGEVLNNELAARHGSRDFIDG